MKNITSLFAIAMLSTMSMSGLTSCSNDDTIEITAAHLQGVWMHNDKDDYDYLQFNIDGTGSKWEVYKNAPDARPHDQEDFTYSINNGKITFYEPDGERDVEKIKMNAPDEIVIDRDTYKKQNQ